MVEKAMQIDQEWIPQGCELICDYLTAIAEMDRIEPYAERSRRWKQLVTESEAQLPSISADAKLLPHELAEEGISTLAEVLKGFPQVGRAYVVRRELPALPHRRFYYVCVEWRTHSLVLNEGRLINKIASSVSFSDGAAWFFAIGSDWWLRERLKRVPGSLVYKRPLFGR